MPTETEELRIRVTLDDQASAGIERIHEQVKSISHERHRDFFDKLGREFKSIRPIIGEAGGEFAKVTEHLAVFTRFGGAVGGIATAIALAAIETAKQTKEFADQLNEIFRTATYAGFGAQQLKNLYDVLRGVNDIPPEQFEAIATSVGEGIDELLRQGSPLRQWFESQTPAMGKAAEEFFGGMEEERKRKDVGAMMTRYMNLPALLEKLAKEQGWSDENAAAFRRQAAQRLHLPWSVAGREWKAVRTATEDEEKKLEELHKMSMEWEHQMGRVREALHEIRTVMDDWTAKNAFDENGIVVKSFVWIATTLERLYHSLVEIKEFGLSKFLKRHGATEQPPIGINPGFDEEQRRKLEEFRRGRGAPPRPGGTALQLMSVEEDAGEQLAFTAELVAEFRRFNALLSGEEEPLKSGQDLAAQLGGGSIGKSPTFHNQPMGGTAGESNPMTLPPGSTQPGGGSAAEAVGPTGHGWDIATQRKVLQKWKGATEGASKSSVYGTYGPFSDIGQDKPGSASLGQLWGMKYFPEERQGIALREASTLGRLYKVTAPSGAVSIEQHTDIGPSKTYKGKPLGRDIDISAAAALRLGYTPQTFPTDKGEFKYELMPSFGEEARMQRSAAAASIGRPGADGQALMSAPETTPTSALRPSVRSYQAAQRALQAPRLAADAETARSRVALDRDLADESGTEARGNLNVNVRAPAGTEVRADGDGMFKGNVSLDRQMSMPTLQ
jgi:hypothetical protein